jgi:hypothetical protein
MRDENGNSIEPNAAKAAALIYGVGASVIEAAQLDKLLSVFPGAKKLLTREGIKGLLKNQTVRGALTALVKNYGADLSFETLTEIAQQGLQIMLREGAKAQTNEGGEASFEPAGASEIVSELWETGKSSLVQFALPMLPGPAMTFMSDYRSARLAERNVHIFEAMSDAAKASKLKERSPETFGAMVEKITESGPVNEVGISAEAFGTYFQSAGIDPSAVAEELGVGEKYAEALETGGDVVIPMSTFAAKLAGTEHFNGLKDDLRLGDENAMTPREAREFSNRVAEEYRQEAEKSARKEEERKEQDQVREDIKAQLEHLGVKWLGKREAEDYSAILAAGMANEARAAGIGLKEYADSWELRFAYDPKTGKVRMERLAGRGQSFTQPVNPDVDLNAEVPVLELRSDTGVPVTRKVILDRLAALVEEGAFVTLDELGELEIPDGKKKRKHLAYSSRMMTSEETSKRQARNISLMSLADIVRGSVLIESVGNNDADKKKAKSFHRFYIPVKTNDGTFTIRLVAESEDDKTLRPVKGEIYDLIAEKEDASPHPRPDSDESHQVIGSEAPSLKIRIREMLRGVKDAEGLPYVLQQTVYHGGPHRGIVKMLLDKIGTGEGRQAFGWGLYFASNKRLAEWYREKLSGSYIPRTAEVGGKKYTLDRSN